MAPTKNSPVPRKMSRKSKRSWRKNIDMSDVDQHLNNTTSSEERMKTPVSELSDTQLFTIDTSMMASSTPIHNKKERRTILLSTEPRCFASLKPQGPDPIVKSKEVQKPQAKTDLANKPTETHTVHKEWCQLYKAQKRQDKSTQTNKPTETQNGHVEVGKANEAQASQAKTVAEKKVSQTSKPTEFREDLWGLNKKELEILGKCVWMLPAAQRHALMQLGIKKRRLPASLHKKTSVLPAIEVPHPGTSYNPSYKDHQNLLRNVATEEMKVMKEEEHLNRVTSKMFTKVSAEQKEKNMIQEMSQGLPFENKESTSRDKPENEEAKIEDSEKFVNAPVKNKMKTSKQRRKQREQRELARMMEAKKIEKKKVSELYKLKQLIHCLELYQKKQNLLREKRLLLREKKLKETKTLSRIKFTPVEQEFNMPAELSGNLRNTLAKTSLLKDRYKSMQQRNILAPATLVLKRPHAKLKRFIKDDHKIPEINIQDVKQSYGVETSKQK